MFEAQQKRLVWMEQSEPEGVIGDEVREMAGKQIKQIILVRTLVFIE